MTLGHVMLDPSPWGPRHRPERESQGKRGIRQRHVLCSTVIFPLFPSHFPHSSLVLSCPYHGQIKSHKWEMQVNGFAQVGAASGGTGVPKGHGSLGDRAGSH